MDRESRHSSGSDLARDNGPHRASSGEDPSDDESQAPSSSGELSDEPLESIDPEPESPGSDEELELLGPGGIDEFELHATIDEGLEFDDDPAIETNAQELRNLDPTELLAALPDDEDEEAASTLVGSPETLFEFPQESGDDFDDSDDLLEIDYQLRIPSDADTTDDEPGAALDIGKLAVPDEPTLDDDAEGPLESITALGSAYGLGSASDDAADNGDEISTAPSPSAVSVPDLSIATAQQWSVGFELETEWDCFCPDGDALFVARGSLDRIDPTGQDTTLCDLGGMRVRQIARSDSGLLLSSPGGLHLVTSDESELNTVAPPDDERWQSPATITRHLGRTTVSDSLGRRCALVGRSLVALPALEHLIVNSEQSGEFALVRAGRKDALHHLPTSATLPATGLRARQVCDLVSLAGHLVVTLRDGRVQVFDSGGGQRHEFTLEHRLRALTLGLDDGQLLAWLVLSANDERLSVAQVQLESGTATQIWTSPWTTTDDSDIAIRWGSDEQALFLGAGEHLLRLNRPNTC